MTTIVYSRTERTMACDSSMLVGDVRYVCKDKVVRLKDGSLFGGAGDGSCISKLRRYLDGDLKRPPKLSSVNAIRVKPDGAVWLYINDHDGDEVEDEAAAVGTGATAAKVAMSCGVTVRQAVERACQFDADSCLPVHEYRLDG